jgi:hypothetical protein
MDQNDRIVEFVRAQTELLAQEQQAEIDETARFPSYD